MEIKIAHCADIHIGAKNPSLYDNYKSESFINKAVFFNILEKCKAKKVDFLLVAGDLFDDVNIPACEIDEIKNELSKSKVKTVITPGNHDPFTPDSPYSSEAWPENVWIFKSKKMKYFEFSELNLRIFGAAFCKMYEDKCLLSKSEIINDNFINIGVMHGEISNSNRSLYNPISTLNIEKSCLDYLALGHIHKRSRIFKSGKTFYAYSGSPQGQGFNELGEKGIYIGTISKESCKLEFEKACIYKYEKLFADISECHTQSEIVSKIMKEIKLKYGITCFKNIYQISLQGNLEEDFTPEINYLKNTLSKYSISAKLVDETNVKIDIEKLKYRNDFKSIFIKNALKKISASKDENEKILNEEALKLGLKSFSGDVIYSENQKD